MGRWRDAEATAGDCYDGATHAGDVQHQAISLAARALVRAVTGRPSEARTDAEAALALSGERSVALARIHAHLGRVPMPFERARTLLILGTVQRRAKRRADARATLEAAEASFTELGTDV